VELDRSASCAAGQTGGRRARHGTAFAEQDPVASKKNPKNKKQYEALKEKGMSKERAAKIANSPGASSKGGKTSSRGKKRTTKKQGGTTAQKRAAGRKGGKKAARKRS
jgi:hypothetical protein